MALMLVIANLGHAMRSTAAPLPALRHWLSDLSSGGITIGLLQEMPTGPGWDEHLEAAGWNLIDGDEPRYPCRSGIIHRPEVVHLSPTSVPTARYHGSYLTGAVLRTAAGECTLVSAHASPTRLTSRDIATWDAAAPLRRRDYRDGPVNWDSDYVLQTLGLLAAQGPVLAGGDFNEARSWDTRHGGSWGTDWFSNAERLDLVDVTYELWGEERPTRDGYQVDHLLATPTVASAVLNACIGPSPGADHESIWCTIEL